MATTTNYGWTTPNDTDLVKNGASAIRTLGSAVDSSLWTAGYSAGKNKIINGDFGIWQRGTSFTSNSAYNADRWWNERNGSGATYTISQQTFTPATAPVAGYEGTYYLRINQSVAGTGSTYSVFGQKIEDVRTFAGQTVTMSFWAKAGSTITLPTLEMYQDFGSGGSGGVQTSFATSVSIGTSWTRYTYSATVPSISGKTIGTGSYLRFSIYLPLNQTFIFDLWGCQLEAGSTATPFQTATGTKQGELAACQRYYYRTNPLTQAYQDIAVGQAASTTDVRFVLRFPTTMRSTPTSIDYATLRVSDYVNNLTVTNLNGSLYTPDSVELQATVSGATQYRPYLLQGNNSTSSYVGINAEL